MCGSGNALDPTGSQDVPTAVHLPRLSQFGFGAPETAAITLAARSME